MNGLNKSLFCKYTFAMSFPYMAIVSVTIFASTALLAAVPAEIATYTLQREKSVIYAPSSLHAKQVPEIEIIEQGGIYQIKMVAVIDAPASDVRHVLTDFQHIYRLNPSIIESDVVKRHDDGSVSVRMRIIGCVAYFCEEIDRVERVRVLPSGDLHAEIIPELSQFKSGQTLWRIKSLGDQCEVSYIADMEPDIFIPPVVGKFLIKKSIREEMKISFANLEKISNVQSERVWQENYQPAHTEFASYDHCVNYAENSLIGTY
ncbi:MAG: SRPBCC family protein [Gammaproteobacteria bacterium]|nr:SRPBCC family protein [Gammaproteobacteria bacterium]